MTGLTPYVLFPGNAEEALEFYQSVFGGQLQLHRYADFSRSDGPADAIAHGVLDGPVSLYGSDAGADDDALALSGIFFSLLGTAEPETLHRWFDGLAVNARVLQPLEARAWGAHDGQLLDRYGIRWLIGYETSSD